jgi:RHS repeat-associated protein
VKVDGQQNPVYSKAYGYDPVGNRTSLVDPSGTTTYSYNYLNQLVLVQHPDQTQTVYSYDTNGNRSTKVENANTTQYGYDFDNHLTQVSDNNGLVGQYGYSGDGLRVAKATVAGTGGFVYDGDRVIQETDQNGVTTATYTATAGSVYAPLVGIRNSAGSHVPLPDALSSVRVLLDAGQNFTDGYAFEGFGRPVSGGGATPNPYRYVGLFGYYEDLETGLTLLSRRYYDAVAGRFLTRDPIDYAGGAKASSTNKLTTGHVPRGLN